MKRSFEHVSLRALRNSPVTMQIAKPFAVLSVWKASETPIVHLLMHGSVFYVAR